MLCGKTSQKGLTPDLLLWLALGIPPWQAQRAPLPLRALLQPMPSLECSNRLMLLGQGLQALSRRSCRLSLVLLSGCPNRHRRQGLHLLTANISTWAPQFEAFLFIQAVGLAILISLPGDKLLTSALRVH